MNTTQVYDPKLLEFAAYCRQLYGNSESSVFITAEKVFGFLYYQAYREKKTTRSKGNFDSEEFDRVMAMEDASVSNVADPQGQSKGNWVGHQMLNQYLSALRSMLDTQRSAGHVSLLNAELMTEQLKDLMKNVKTRKESVFKLQFKERIDGEFLPFKMLIEIPKIETYLWMSKSNTKVYGLTSLRNRFHYLYTLQAVMRSESLFKTDMADLCDFKFLQKRESAPYHIIVNRIGRGKTVKEKVHFGKVMQHKDVLRCSIGALGLMFLGRFHILNEHQTMDFTNNESWFNKKLLSSPIGDEHGKFSFFTLYSGFNRI